MIFVFGFFLDLFNSSMISKKWRKANWGQIFLLSQEDRLCQLQFLL